MARFSGFSVVLLDDEALGLAVPEEEVLEPTPEVAPEEVEESIVETNDADVAVVEEVATLGDTSEVIETLESLYVALGRVHTEGFSRSAKDFLDITLDSIERRTRGGLNIQAINDYSSESALNESVSLSMESVGEGIKKAWTVFINLLKSIASKIAGFFGSLFNTLGSVKSNSEALLKKLTSGYNNAAEGEVAVQGSWLSVGKAVEPLAAVEAVTKVYGEAAAEIGKNAKTISTAFRKAATSGSEDDAAELTSIAQAIEKERSESYGKIFLANSTVAGHTARVVNGAVVYSAVRGSYPSKIKVPSLDETRKLLGGVIKLADVLLKKKELVNAVEKSLKEEVAVLEKLSKQAGDQGTRAVSYVLTNLQKLSVKKETTSLNGIGSVSGRVAVAAYKLAVASAKKLESGAKDATKALDAPKAD